MFNYKQMEEKDFLYLKSIVANDSIFCKGEIAKEYGKDELGTVISMPECVCLVQSAEEISKIVAYANTEKIPVVCRGSGTGLVGSCVPLHGGIVIDTTKMNHFLELDEDNLTLTVEPGVLLMDIYDYVEQRGYFYAPDPGEKTATIGGNIATNAGGMRAVKYGTTRDWVRALEVVLADGTIETFGRKVVKDSTGYSLKNLIIGSEGTLGIITKAVLKIIPKPKETISLLVPFRTQEEAIEAVPKIIKEGMNTIAIEFFVRKTILFAEEYLGKRFPDTKNDAYILLTFEGDNKEELTKNYEKAASLCVDRLNAIDALLVDTAERKDDVWKARGSFLEAIKASTTQMDECDVVVPRSKVAEYIKYTYELAKEYQMRIPSFGHAGDGNLHIYLCRDNYSEKDFELLLEKVFEKMYTKAKEVGGLVSGEHGIGYAKKGYMQALLGETQIKLMNGIKKVFDPNNILNPGKVSQ